jgi:hypothetical protein
MCSVAINVLEPGTFNAESQYFIPLFNRISWLCGQHPRGWSIKWGVQLRANRAWLSKLLKYLFFIFHHENRSLLKMSKPVRFSNRMPGENMSGSHLQWEPSVQFSWHFSSPTLTDRFSLRIELKIDASYSNVEVVILRVTTANTWFIIFFIQASFTFCNFWNLS